MDIAHEDGIAGLLGELYLTFLLSVMTMPNPHLGLVNTPILVQPLPSS